MSRGPSKQRPVLLNAGCGAPAHESIPAYFNSWRQIRVDINPATRPDILASIVDLSAITDQTVQAVWSSHCIEHLFAHEVPQALAEFRRVLSDNGFACIVVPDLQAIAGWIAADRLHEPIYESAAGTVTPHDMMWGFGPAIAAGDVTMAHRCGFTPTVFLQRLHAAGFGEIVLRRRSNLELVALALRNAAEDPGRPGLLMEEIGF